MIATDPNQRIGFTLPAYKKLPAEQQPTFFARFITVRQAKRMEDLSNKARAESSADVLCEALAIALVDWRNVTDYNAQPIPFDPAAIPDFVTMQELWELWTLMLTAIGLAEDDLKKSASQQPSPAEPPAIGAPAGAA